MSDFDENTAIVLGGGTVQYDPAEAAADIQEVIDALVEAREDGATHVLMSSGNHRGARWASVSARVSWIGDGEY